MIALFGIPIVESGLPSRLCVRVLDTETGETAVSCEFSEYWWTDGNGSCDCNRELMFHDHEPEPTGTCLGNHRYLDRYLVVAVNGKHPAPEFNAGYPPELLAKFLPKESQ